MNALILEHLEVEIIHFSKTSFEICENLLIKSKLIYIYKYIYIYIYIYRFWIRHHKNYFWSLPLRVLVPFNAKKPQDKHRFWVQRHKPSFWSLLSGVLVPFQCQKRQGVKQIFLVKHRKSLFWWLPLRVLAPEPEVEIWEGDKYPPPQSRSSGFRLMGDTQIFENFRSRRLRRRKSSPF